MPLTFDSLRKVAVLVLGAAAVWLALSLFDIGFRTTADQLKFLDSALAFSFLDLLAHARDVAISSGRIGFVGVISLSHWGELIGDLFFYPALCIGLLLAMAWATFRWAELLAGGHFALPLTALFIALLPLGLHHWLPNAYAPQFLPLALALLARAWWLGSESPPMWAKVVAAVVIFGGALAFELNFAMLSAMAIVEAAIWAVARHRQRMAPGLSGRFVLWQLAILLLSIALYVAFRLRYPSAYSGNQPAGLDQLGDAAVTFALHLWESPSIALILDRFAVLPTDPRTLAAAAVVAIGLAAIASLVSLPSRIWGLVMLASGLLIAAAVTLPIAIVGKYIDWCLVGRECAYLDSRFALMGLVLAVAGALLLFLGTSRARKALIAVVAIAGPLTFLANSAERPHLLTYKTAETAARQFVCTNPDPGADSGPIVIELAGLPVAFHPEYDVDRKTAFWSSYIAHLRNLRPLWFCP